MFSLPFVVAASGLVAPGPGESAFTGWFPAFLVTLVLEVSMVLVAWRFRACRGPLHRWLGAVVLANLVSHPLATLALSHFAATLAPKSLAWSYAGLELAVFAFETWLFRVRVTPDWRQAVFASAAANSVTAMIGAYLMFASG